MGRIYQYPLKQHIGGKAVPVVVEGDKVKRGQLLAFQGENPLGSNLYSSISGTVSSLTKDVIRIRADEEQASGYEKLTESSPLELIREAGIVGLGGAGFPTYAKFSRPFSGGGTVVLNAAECEPILCHNLKRMEQNTRELLRGLEIAMEVSGARHGVVAIKKHHALAIAKLRETNRNPAIRLALLDDLYPMGEERAVIREVFGTLLPVTALPREADAIVLNAETVYRIFEAVEKRKPFIDKDLTVGGKIKGNEQEKLIQVFLDVPIGKTVGDVFEEAGGLSGRYGELIMGGPFTGKRTFADAPVVKTTGGLIASECFPKGPEKIGLLVCACGADQARLREQAESMRSAVVGVEYCKQAKEARGSYKCENPGKCPGQVQKILALKKAGAQAVLISNCTDCTNTVMSCAPKLGLAVYHCTDGPLRAVNQKLIRRMR